MLSEITINIIIISIIIWSILMIILGYGIGQMRAIRDDLKSLDYDRIVIENEELKRAIEIKKNH